MKRLYAAIGLAAALLASSASAQNAGQISRARAASCSGCNLFQANLSGLEATGRSYAKARLRQADLSAAMLNRTSFAGADLRDLDAYGAVFGGSNFAGADLTNASFVGTYLEGANFSGARLTGTDFSGAEMDRARGLTQAQLNAACGDPTTRLPRGLRIRPC